MIMTTQPLDETLQANVQNAQEEYDRLLNEIQQAQVEYRTLFEQSVRQPLQDLDQPMEIAPPAVITLPTPAEIQRHADNRTQLNTLIQEVSSTLPTVLIDARELVEATKPPGPETAFIDAVAKQYLGGQPNKPTSESMTTSATTTSASTSSQPAGLQSPNSQLFAKLGYALR